MAYLGEFGEYVDHETLVQAYASTSDPLGRSAIVGALRGADKALRNTFFSRTQGEDENIDRAIDWAKANG